MDHRAPCDNQASKTLLITLRDIILIFCGVLANLTTLPKILNVIFYERLRRRLLPAREDAPSSAAFDVRGRRGLPR